MGSRDRSRSRDRRRSRSRDRSRRWDRDRRSRSRSRDHRRSRSRSKSRSRSRDRAKTLAYDASISAVQAMAALQQQQQLQRQLLAQQLLLQQQAAAAAAALAPPAQAQQSTNAATADRKAREIYVGNLAIGVVNADMLKELFNSILANQVTDPSQPPVVNVNLDTSGRFAFIEFRTRELTDAAIQLDKLELCGRQMNIGRPKGYVDAGSQLANAAKMGQAQVLAATLAGSVPAPATTLAAAAATLTVTTPTNVVLLENMVSCGTIRDENERKEAAGVATGRAGARSRQGSRPSKQLFVAKGRLSVEGRWSRGCVPVPVCLPLFLASCPHVFLCCGTVRPVCAPRPLSFVLVLPRSVCGCCMWSQPHCAGLPPPLPVPLVCGLVRVCPCSALAVALRTRFCPAPCPFVASAPVPPACSGSRCCCRPRCWCCCCWCRRCCCCTRCLTGCRLDATAVRKGQWAPAPPTAATILEDVQQEVVKCGPVIGLAVPMPPAHVANHEPSRVYVKYSTAAEAARCRTMMDGRKFDDNAVRASFVTEGEFLRAQAGEWVAKPGLLMPAGVPAIPAVAAAPALAGLGTLGATAPAAVPVPGHAPIQQAAGLVLPPGFTLPAGFSLAGALPGLGLPK